MTDETIRLHQPAAEVSQEALARAEEMIEREEGAHNKLRGWLAALVGVVLVVMSVFHLYTAYEIVRIAKDVKGVSEVVTDIEPPPIEYMHP